MDQLLFDEKDMVNNFSPNPLAKQEEIKEEEVSFDIESNEEYIMHYCLTKDFRIRRKH